MFFLWCMLPFFNLIVLVKDGHEREEEDNAHLHNDPFYEHKRKVWKGVKMKVAIKVETKIH